VGYGHWFNAWLPWLGYCAVLVRDGVVDYGGHISFDGCPSETGWKHSRGDEREALCEHDNSAYEDIVVSYITDDLRYEAIDVLRLAVIDVCMFHVDFQDDVFPRPGFTMSMLMSESVASKYRK
jgi:hypothetical protein